MYEYLAPLELQHKVVLLYIGYYVVEAAFFVLTRFYYQKRNLTHHIKSSHEGKKYECTYPDCDWKLCTLVSEICMKRIAFHMYLEYIVTFSLE